jgi:GT2 family glycosyltransferase
MPQPLAPLGPGLPVDPWLVPEPATGDDPPDAPYTAGALAGATGSVIYRPRSREQFRQAAWRRRFLDTTPVDVSVCIANWNCRELLRGCLESLLDQSQGVRLEVIVVDNASRDGAADLVEHQFPDVLLVRNPANFGFARANNQAARRAQGRYLFFLNNDTAVPAGGLRKLVDYAEAHPEVGMIGPRLRDGQGRWQVSYRLRPTMATLLHRTSLLRWTGVLRAAYRRYRRWDFDPHTVRRVDVLMGAAVLLRRNVFFGCGGWDEDFWFGGEDLDLSARVGRSYSLVYLPRVEVIHYGRASTRQHIGFASTQMAIGFVRYLRKAGCPAPALWAYKLAVTLDAPLQFVGKGLQYLWRRLRGRRAKAAKSLLAWKGLGHFLWKGLGGFWKA